MQKSSQQDIKDAEAAARKYDFNNNNNMLNTFSGAESKKEQVETPTVVAASESSLSNSTLALLFHGGQTNIFTEIFSHITVSDLLTVSESNKTLSALSTANWQALIQKYFPYARELRRESFEKEPRKLFGSEIERYRRYLDVAPLKITELLGALAGDEKIISAARDSRKITCAALAVSNNHLRFLPILLGNNSFYSEDAQTLNDGNLLLSKWHNLIKLVLEKKYFSLIGALFGYDKIMKSFEEPATKKTLLIRALFDMAVHGKLPKELLEKNTTLRNELKKAAVLMGPSFKKIPIKERIEYLLTALKIPVTEENFQLLISGMLGQHEDNLLRIAAEWHHPEVVEMFLTHPRLVPFSQEAEVQAAAVAAGKGYADIVELFIKHGHFQQKIIDAAGLAATNYQHPNLVKALVHRMSDASIKEAFSLAVNRNNNKLVDIFLTARAKSLDASTKGNALVSAAEGGYVKMLNRLLALPSVKQHATALKRGVKKNFPAIVELLLRDAKLNKKIKPKTLGSEFYLAATSNHWEIVALFIKHVSADLLKEKLLVVTLLAIQKGQFSVVRSLIELQISDPHVLENALVASAGAGRPEIVTYVLEQAGAYITPEMKKSACDVAKKGGFLELVKLIEAYQKGEEIAPAGARVPVVHYPVDRKITAEHAVKYIYGQEKYDPQQHPLVSEVIADNKAEKALLLKFAKRIHEQEQEIASLKKQLLSQTFSEGPKIIAEPFLPSYGKRGKEEVDLEASEDTPLLKRHRLS